MMSEARPPGECIILDYYVLFTRFGLKMMTQNGWFSKSLVKLNILVPSFIAYIVTYYYYASNQSISFAQLLVQYGISST
jgi:hypothetical protein